MFVEAPVRTASARQIVSLAFAAMATVAAVVVFATSDLDGSESAPAVASAQAEFDHLPRYPRSEPLGTVVETGGALSRAFRVDAVAPPVVLEFYTDSLLGWRRLRPTGAATEATGRWVSGAYEVTVTAHVHEGAGDGGQLTEYVVALREV